MRRVQLRPWLLCDLEEEILSVLEADGQVSTRHLCALLFPMIGWVEAEGLVAETVRSHCRLLMQARLIRQTGEDEFALRVLASA